MSVISKGNWSECVCRWSWRHSIGLVKWRHTDDEQQLPECRWRWRQHIGLFQQWRHTDDKQRLPECRWRWRQHTGLAEQWRHTDDEADQRFPECRWRWRQYIGLVKQWRHTDDEAKQQLPECHWCWCQYFIAVSTIYHKDLTGCKGIPVCNSTQMSDSYIRHTKNLFWPTQFTQVNICIFIMAHNFSFAVLLTGHFANEQFCWQPFRVTVRVQVSEWVSFLQWRLQGGARGGHGPLWQISGPPFGPPVSAVSPSCKIL